MDIYSVFATIVKANILLQDKLFPSSISADFIFMFILQQVKLCIIYIIYPLLSAFFFLLLLKKYDDMNW